MRPTLLITACLLGLALPAAAQTTANPLQRPAPSATTAPAAPVTAPGKVIAPTADAAKPKRARSEAQLKNDERLRTCGAEWRANKAKLTAQGYNWIKYSGECRKRLAAQGR